VAGAVSEERLGSFHKLRREAQHHEIMADPLAAQERKRKWKIIHKAMRKR
jgi:ribosome biogenesis GTPase